MKKHLAAAFVMVLAAAATAQARVDLSVNIGVPVAVAPAPAPVVTYPAYAAPVAYAEPGFIYSPRLGFYVSVGLPYDVVYVDNRYYRYRGGNWYMSPTYGGRWSYIASHRLPQGLHRHHYDNIRYYRDREYRSYLSDRDHYRGKWYRPASLREHKDWDGRVIDRRHDRDRDGRDDHFERDRDGRRDRDWTHDRGRR